MEEPNQIPNPPQISKKRPFEDGLSIENSSYFKISAILRDIRPRFIEVLKTPDFQNCKAAQEIRDQMKIMMDLYKEMISEKISVTRCTNVPDTQTLLSDDTLDAQKLKEGSPVERKLISTIAVSEDSQSVDGRPQGTFIVGGSAFGWNFITYPGGKAVYYGRTKEMFRSANVVVTNDSAVISNEMPIVD